MTPSPLQAWRRDRRKSHGRVPSLRCQRKSSILCSSIPRTLFLIENGNTIVRGRFDGGHRWAYSRAHHPHALARLRKPIKGLNCNGIRARLSTEPDQAAALGDCHWLRASWNDKDLEPLVPGEVRLRAPGCRFGAEDSKHR